MRVLPYRSLEDWIDGVVVTFSEITALKERERQQALIVELGLCALQASSFDELVRQSLPLLTSAVAADLAEVCQLDADSRQIRAIATAGFDHEQTASAPEPVDDLRRAPWSFGARPAELGEPSDRLTKEGVCSGLRSAIWVGRNTPFGLLGVYRRTPRGFSKEDQLFLDAAAHVFASALHRRTAERALSDAREAAALARAQEELRRAERLASLGTFAAGIAHEVNNPLTNIALAAEYVQRTDDPARRQELLSGIVKNARRCGKVVESVLSLARDESTKRWPNAVNDILRRGAELVRSSVDGERLELVFELAEPSPRVECNPIEIEQVVVNLMKNALEASAGRCRIELQSSEAAGKVRVSIGDDGPGISAEDRDRIFDPFFSTRRNAGGTGLGLSICHRIVAAHGGTIALAPGVARGARFEIELPGSTAALED